MDPFKSELSLYSYECPLITDEEFNVFHTIDREFFTILVHGLRLDPAIAMQVVALFMWLETQCADMHLIKRMANVPLGLLQLIVDEAFLCLKCAENDNNMFNEVALDIGLRFLPEYMNNPNISLRYFHENRIAVLKGVREIMKNVCERVFRDILQRTWQAGVAARRGSEGMESSRMGERRNVIGGMVVPPMVQPQQPMNTWHGDIAARGTVLPAQQMMHAWQRGGLPPVLNTPAVQLLPGGQRGWVWLPSPLSPTPQVVSPQPLRHNVPAVEQGIGLPLHMLGVERFPVHDLEGQHQLLVNEVGDMFRRNAVIGNREEIGSEIYADGAEEETAGVVVDEAEEEVVPPDDRTIFLTFSRGYPISEDEVRDFFTRRFGDFIEDIIMQEVGRGEQALYAKMVARSASVIAGITEGRRVKYSIKGKHVVARKYVKREQNTSVAESSSSQQANAPSE